MGSLTHHEVEELLGAYALDAVDPDEAAEVEDHLAECPRCQAELAEHREVAGLFAYAGQTAPAGLWDRITASMQETPPELRMDRIRPSMMTPELFQSAQGGEPGAEPPIASLDQYRRRRSVGVRTFLASVAAAAAVAAFIGVSAQDNNKHHTAPSAVAPLAAVHQALRQAGSHRVVLRSINGTGASLDAVVTPSGAGYLYDSTLTPLSADRTYQLWGVVGTSEISYGVIGSDPSGVIPFRAGTGVDELAVTNEVSSGVVENRQEPIAQSAVFPSL